jgi:hypothetical protein
MMLFNVKKVIEFLKTICRHLACMNTLNERTTGDSFLTVILLTNKIQILELANHS